MALITLMKTMKTKKMTMTKRKDIEKMKREIEKK
jgi:hypothetical protein